MAYESFGGGAYGNGNDYEGNPFSDQTFSSNINSDNNDERVIDFERSSDQPDNMRANGAYDSNEPSWHQRLPQENHDAGNFMDEKQANRTSTESSLKTSLLRKEDIDIEDDRLPRGGNAPRRRKSMLCCDRKQAKYAFFITNLVIAAIMSLAIFSWSLVQNLNVKLNIGIEPSKPSGCIDANKCLLDAKSLKDNKCVFQYSASDSCATSHIKQYDYKNKWPTPVKLRCNNFPKGEYFSSPWDITNSKIRQYSTIFGFLLSGIYYIMARRCDCCVQFSLASVEILMYIQAIIAFICCGIDNAALGGVQEACSNKFKVKKYQSKTIPICSLSGNGLECDLKEFYWLAFANLALAVSWILSGVSLRSYRKHKTNVPTLN
jgi:hypothetical protein